MEWITTRRDESIRRKDKFRLNCNRKLAQPITEVVVLKLTSRRCAKSDLDVSQSNCIILLKLKILNLLLVSIDTNQYRVYFCLGKLQFCFNFEIVLPVGQNCPQVSCFNSRQEGSIIKQNEKLKSQHS